MMGIIYLLTFKDKKCYVGRTITSLKARYRLHRYNAKNMDRSDAELYYAWRKYGEPDSKVLEEVADEFLDKREIYWIKKLRTISPKGYNMTDGGNVSSMLYPAVVKKMVAAKTGMRHTEETKALMSASHVGRESPNKGKSFSKEWRDNMAKAHTGRKHSEATLAKMSASRAAYWAARRAERAA